MNHVRLMPPNDVLAARVHGNLRPGRITKGCIVEPVEAVISGAQDRRHCRSCGFRIGQHEALLMFGYMWPRRELGDRSWETSVVVHTADCRPGAAHDLVTSGHRLRVQGEVIDEVDATLLRLWLSGQSQSEIGARVGTSPASVATVLDGLCRQFDLIGNPRRRMAAARLLEPSSAAALTGHDQVDALLDLLR